MRAEEPQPARRPLDFGQPFPWRCRRCYKNEVVMATTEYDAEVQHDGRFHDLRIPSLKIPVCQACGEKVFTEDVDQQINDALRAHLKMLTPDEIRAALKELDLSQEELARRLGIAVATVSRWLNGVRIQSKPLDNLMRVFFAVPQVREILCGDP